KVRKPGDRRLIALTSRRNDQPVVRQRIGLTVRVRYADPPVVRIDRFDPPCIKIDVGRREKLVQGGGHRRGITLVKPWPDDQSGLRSDDRDFQIGGGNPFLIAQTGSRERGQQSGKACSYNDDFLCHSVSPVRELRWI